MRNYSFIILLPLIAFIALSQCPETAVLSSSGQCVTPAYIEGCYMYASSTACSQCQFNYQLDGKICTYSPNPTSKCCKMFSPSGVCSDCEIGLVLENGICKDWKIIGCLQKNKQTCIKCANNYSLSNGKCYKNIQNCIAYAADASCTTCTSTYKLIAGQCINNPCIYPFKPTSNGDCWVDGCVKTFQYGCQQCTDGYSLLPDYSCKYGSIEGCLKYNSYGDCLSCYQSRYWLSNGICLPNGCKTLKKEGGCYECLNGFILASGKCTFPKCAIVSKDGCQVCESSFVLTVRGCQMLQPKQQCTTCKKGFRATSNFKCVPNQPGCLEYLGDSCNKCQPNLYLNPNKQCITKQWGCVYQNGYCNQCQTPYTWVSKACIIDSCKSYCKSGCQKCMQGYVLTSMNTCTLPNCIQIKNGKCIKCVDGYQLKQDGTCVKSDPYCQTYDAKYLCIQCITGYYLAKDKTCQVTKFGCNYVDGRCVSCISPFTYNPKVEGCEIDGCKTYFLGGCSTCMDGYQVRYNMCKLPNCLTSINGRCKQCDPDYVMRSDGICVNKDEFCYKYDANGWCIECAPKYFLNSAKKCTLREPGCLYNSKDTCYACEKPFYFDGIRCQIYGCLTLGYDGCKECSYPYIVNSSKVCQVEYCDAMENGKCKLCKVGYMLGGNGGCILQDPSCLAYGSKGCTQCIKGYRVDANGRCQYADEHCWDFTKEGNCMNCDRLYFFNKQKKCQLKDNNCKAYSNGYCQQCKDMFYTYSGLCYPNTKGCLMQKNIKECTKCDPSYTLKQGVCVPAITKLTYNSIDLSDDFFTGDTDADKANAQQIFSIGKDNKVNLYPAIKNGGKVFYSKCDTKSPMFQTDTDGEGWKIVTSSNTKNYIGVQMTSSQIFYAVDIKILPSNTLTKFSIEYSEDNISFRQGGDFSITNKVVSSVSTFYFTPVMAISIRIVAITGNPNIKFQFYYSANITNTQTQVNTYISQTIQTTIVDSLEVRVFSTNDECVDKQLCWMGLELCEAKDIYGFELVAAPNNQGSISQVYMDYSVDGVKFICYSQCSSIKVINNIIKLAEKVVGSKFRVHLTKWDGKPNYGIKFNYQM